MELTSKEMIGLIATFGVFFLSLAVGGLVSYSKMAGRMLALEGQVQVLSAALAVAQKTADEIKGMVIAIQIAQAKTDTRAETLQSIQSAVHSKD